MHYFEEKNKECVSCIFVLYPDFRQSSHMLEKCKSFGRLYLYSQALVGTFHDYN